jgi:hypothetical protein
MKKIELLFYLLKQVVPRGIGELTRIKRQIFFKHAISAPAERPVFSHRQERGLSHVVVTSLKLKHRFGLCPAQIGQMHADFLPLRQYRFQTD